MKSSFLKWVLFSLVGFTAGAGVAGGVSDGGANAIVCRSGESITSVELLDLYEARTLWSLRRLDASQSEQEIAQSIIPRFDKALPEYGLADSYSKILNSKRVLPAGVRLKPIADSDHFIVPANCSVEQAALYRGSTSEVFIVGDFWEKMDSVNRVAVLIHEALYAQMRMFGETSSVRTRRAVGQLMAGAQFAPFWEGVPVGSQYCETAKDPILEWPFFSFVIFADKGQTRVQFRNFNGNFVVGKTVALMSAVWPPKTNERWLTVMVLESFVDGGKKVVINLRPQGDALQYEIGMFSGNLSFEKYPFHCRFITQLP